MLNKQNISLLLCTVLLIAVIPPRAISQTQMRSEAVPVKINFNKVQVEPKPDLRTVFAERLARIKDGTLTEADFKRFQQDPQGPQPPKKPRFTKSEKIMLVSFIVGVTALVVLVAVKGVKDPLPFCDTAPWEPNCI